MEEFRPDIREAMEYVYSLVAAMGGNATITYQRSMVLDKDTGVHMSEPKWRLTCDFGEGMLSYLHGWRGDAPILAALVQKFNDEYRGQLERAMSHGNNLVASCTGLASQMRDFPIPEEDAMKQLQPKTFHELAGDQQQKPGAMEVTVRLSEDTMSSIWDAPMTSVSMAGSPVAGPAIVASLLGNTAPEPAGVHANHSFIKKLPVDNQS